MTKEELKQEAEESFEQYKVTDEDYVVSPYSDDMGEKMLMYNDEYYAEETYLRLYKQGYLAGAEPREKRIAELEKRCANYEMNISKMEKGTCDICKETKKDKKIADLEKENAELKKEWQEQVQKATDEGYARTLQTMQLSKAKELLKRFIELENCTLDYDDIKEAEQFISEVEK